MSYIYDVYWQCRKTDKTFVFLSFDGNLLTYQGKALGASWVLFLVHGKANGLYIVRRRRMTVFFLDWRKMYSRAHESMQLWDKQKQNNRKDICTKEVIRCRKNMKTGLQKKDLSR